MQSQSFLDYAFVIHESRYRFRCRDLRITFHEVSLRILDSSHPVFCMSQPPHKKARTRNKQQRFTTEQVQVLKNLAGDPRFPPSQLAKHPKLATFTPAQISSKLYEMKRAKKTALGKRPNPLATNADISTISWHRKKFTSQTRERRMIF